MLHEALCIISKPSVHSNWSYSPETPNSGQNQQFSVPCDLKIWWMTLKNNRAPVLCYFKLCALFCSHMWIQTGVTVWKLLIWLLTSVTLTFDLWPCPLAWASLLSMVIISWLYDDRNIVKKVWQIDRQRYRQTERQADGRTDGQIEVFLELLGHS